MQNIAENLGAKVAATTTSQTSVHSANLACFEALETWPSPEVVLAKLATGELRDGEMQAARSDAVNIFLFLFLSAPGGGPLRTLLRTELTKLLSEESDKPPTVPASDRGR